MKDLSTTDNPILQYWQLIQSGEIVACQKIKAIYKQLAADVLSTDGPYEYNADRANHAIDFIETYCRHSQGQQGGQPFKLELWQRAMTAALFGFVDKKDSTRQYREFVLIVARKNGKSAWGSAVALYMLFADGEAGPQVVSAATKRDQAKIIWSEAKRMVRKSPALSKRARCLVGEIITDFNEGSFKPLSSESNTLDGLNVHCSLIDELHAIEDKNLYDVIVDGMSARKQPLSVITTTAGTVREGIFDLKYNECERILNGFTDGQYQDKRVLPIIYELDKRNEWTRPECWIKANPGLGTIKSLDQLKDKVHRAQHDPMLVKNLLCKDFNVRETSSEAWLPFEDINNTATFDVGQQRPRYGIGGADLSSTTDLTNATVIYQLPDNEMIYVLQMYWLPEDLLAKRVCEDKIPYDIWCDRGLLRVTPGNKVHHKYITEWFLEVQNELDIYLPWIGYDSWSATYWVEEMQNAFGVQSMEPVIQGKKTLSGPMKSMGADLAAKRINYNNNPVLKWCLTNTSVEIDKNNNIQPHKGNNQRRRIDGTAGLLNAYVTLYQHYEEYQTMI